MPLSEYEQRVLQELERDLRADPRLGRTMSRPVRTRGRLALAAGGIVVGLCLLVVGAASQLIVVGVAGFAVMAASALWAILAPSASSKAGKKAATKPAQSRGRTSDQRQGFMSELEDRFDRRREEGDL